MPESALAGLAFGGNLEPKDEPTTGTENEPVGGNEEHFEAQPDTAAEEQAKVERQARVKGWRPKEVFRGKPEEWVDAQTFLKRANEMMPIVNAENRRLKGDLSQQGTLIQSLTQRLENQAKEIEALKATQASATNDQIETELVDGILEARERGDTRAEILLQAKLAAHQNKPAPAPKKTETETTTQRSEKGDHPDFVAWKEDNPWWDEDPVKRSLALGISQKLAREGAFEGLTPRERFDLIGVETEKYGAPARQTQTRQKVNGGRPSGTGGRGESMSQDKTWNALPAAVKAKAMHMASRYKLVGPGKVFKTAAEYQADYASRYEVAGIPVKLVEVPDDE